MKITVNIKKGKVTFSRWCGKGYAIFAALGKQVRIAGLAIHICEAALLKSACKGIIVSDMQSVLDLFRLVESENTSNGYTVCVVMRGEVYGDGFMNKRNNFMKGMRQY